MSIEESVAGIIATATGIRVSPGWPDSINADVAIVDGPTNYEDNDIAGFRIAQTYDITLLFSLTGGMTRARGRLMDYLAPTGAKSIRSALYADPTLGGSVQAFTWGGVQTPPGRIQLNGRGLQAEITVEEYYGCVIQIQTVSAA